MGNDFTKGKPKIIDSEGSDSAVPATPTAMGKSKKNSLFKGGKPFRQRSVGRRNKRVTSKGSTGSAGHKDWLEDQRSLLSGDHTTALLQNKFEEVFKRLSTTVIVDIGSEEEGRQTVSKPVFLSTCKQLFGNDIDSFMFIKLFDFMDSDNNGVVDEVEFAITVCFLLSAIDTTNNTELAYQIFNSSRSGGLTKQDFSEMLAAIIGTSLKTVERIIPIRIVFESFVKSRHMMDGLLFYRQLMTYIDQGEEEQARPPVPIEVAEQIVNTFLLDSAPCMINVAHDIREKLLQDIKTAIEKGEEQVEASVFLKCFQAVVYLLESNTLLPFKDFLRKPPYSEITSTVWKRFKIKKNGNLNFKQFSQWTSENPGIFAFITDMQHSMSDLVDTLRQQSSS